MLSRVGPLGIWVLGGSILTRSNSINADGSHGMLLFLSYKPVSADPDSHPSTEASTSTAHPKQPDPAHPHTHTERPLPNTIPLVDLDKVVESEVDKYWSSQNGKIVRKRDPILCRHGEKAMCDHCMPLEVNL
jgi:nuclear protein localization family protein 4